MKDVATRAADYRADEKVEAPIAAPHRWALSPWAQWFRSLTHWWLVARHVRRYCRPMRIEGLENLATIEGPAIFVANHTSHFDAYVVRSILPARLRRRAAMAAAADRWYSRKKLRAAWFSLILNIYPIQRGGGYAALDYSGQLLERGWSLIIFPEGTRAKKGHMEAFKYGVAILVLRSMAPVVPIYLNGVAGVLPPRERRLRPAPVEAHIGKALTFEPGTAISDVTATLEHVLENMAADPDQREALLVGVA